MSDTDLSHSDIASLKMSATGITLIATLAIFAVKLGAWLVTGSVGILTVVMDSVADTIMGGVNFLAGRQGARHADPHHRFGFGKFESLAGLVQSTFLLGVAIMIIIEGVDRFFHPQPLENMVFGIGSMILVLILILAVVLYQQYVIRMTGSIVVRYRLKVSTGNRLGQLTHLRHKL